MSPEQALGKPLDQRADIYSVGVIMYELFTGKVPFEAESFMGILTKHITTAPMPPRQVAPEREIPAEIEAVILRAMAKEADERYQTMDEVVGELAGDRQRAGAGGAAAAAVVAGAGAASVEAAVGGAAGRAHATPRPTPLPKPPSGAQGSSRATPTPSAPMALAPETAPKKQVGGAVLRGRRGAGRWPRRARSST